MALLDNRAKISALINDIKSLPDKGEGGTANPVLQEKTVTPSTSAQTVTPDSGYDGLSKVTVDAVSTATQATPSIEVSTGGLITASSEQTEGYVVAGTKSSTKQLTVQEAQTITPGTSDKTIASGQYLTGTQTIKGDSNLVAGNIKKGVSIFGVAGALEEGSSGSGAGGNFFKTEAVLASEYATKVGKVLCTIPYIGEHINDDGLFVALIRKDTSEMTLTIPMVMACNSPYLNSSYSMAIQRTQYGASVAYKAGAADGYQLNNSTNTDMPRVYADSSGNVYILPYSSYSFYSGTYSVIYGIL